ncbi:hypothetical protein SEVIR_5G410300v4 [Setaria viridis]
MYLPLKGLAFSHSRLFSANPCMLQVHVALTSEGIKSRTKMSSGSILGAVVARTMAASKVPNLSETARRGCCKLCGEPEEDSKRFLICGHPPCMYKYYHIRCMSPDQIASKKQMNEQCWYCPSCLCRVCHRDEDDKKIILCDGCDEAYHLYCLRPRRTRVPKGKWYCKLCLKARAREVKVKEYEDRMLSEHRKHDLTMVKSDKYTGVDLLLSRVKKWRADDEAAAAEAAITLEMLKGGNEEPATAAE